MVDCFTDWPDIVYMGSNTTTPRLIAALKAFFCRSGAPDIVWSDQGPQLTSKLFRDSEWGFKHVMSTPTYTQSNGKVEATVESMKKLIEASWVRSSLDEGRLARALHQYLWKPTSALFGLPTASDFNLRQHRTSDFISDFYLRQRRTTISDSISDCQRLAS